MAVDRVISGQTDLFGAIFPEISKEINPIREVAKVAGVYWTTSRQILIDLLDTDPDIKMWTRAVKEEYCPYGFAGGYGRSYGPNSMEGWTMKPGKIEVEYLDTKGERITKRYSWEDFAREVADLIWSGEYRR